MSREIFLAKVKQKLMSPPPYASFHIGEATNLVMTLEIDEEGRPGPLAPSWYKKLAP